MAAYKQSNRIGQLKTPLGDDVLALTGFSGTEGLSELFTFEVDALSADDQINFDRLIGKPCTIVLETIGQPERYFVGLLTEATSFDVKTSLNDQEFRYHLTLRPWLWLLSKRTNSRIFHEKPAPDIISTIFREYGASAEFQNKLTKSYPPIEYCVQHRETDLAFVCRLMEVYGISYHFTFSDNHHKLILGDGNSAYEEVPGGSRPYIPIANDQNRTTEHLYDWLPKRHFTTGKSTLNDYDFTKPSANLVAESAGSASYEHATLERYDHPGRVPYTSQGDGKTLSTAVKDAFTAEDKRFVATGDCASLTPGALMNFEGIGGQGGEYLVLHAEHHYKAEAYRSGGDGGTGDAYRGTYEFMSSQVPFAPPQVTPKPLIAGPQTAKVVGKGEIDCDEQGRILVHFHWNRQGEGELEGQSMRCRVAQVWAGTNWGGIYIPRVGMEVLVQFIDGDPDRPIIIGCVYNGDNKPPYPLPSKKNIAGWKSNSTEGGGGYNEFVFDDTKGKELVRMHAQYDHDSTIEHDETRQIKHDRTTKVLNDETMNVTHDIMITADNKLTLKVGASTIVMDPVSITISSPTVSIEAKAEFKSNSSAISTHSAGGPYSITGAIVKIN
jgi:type VI secretion system secreted protein VgrG